MAERRLQPAAAYELLYGRRNGNRRHDRISSRQLSVATANEPYEHLYPYFDGLIERRIRPRTPQTANPVDPLTAAHQRADRLQPRLNDFAQFSRYRDANSKLPLPAKGEQRVVFMGDSITDGWKLDQYFPGAPYVNRGISGQTTSQMLIRFRADVIALKPRVVVILAGTNDISANTGPITNEGIADNIASMVDLARANGINVVLSSVMPVSDYNKNAQGNPDRTDRPQAAGADRRAEQVDQAIRG